MVVPAAAAPLMVWHCRPDVSESASSVSRQLAYAPNVACDATISVRSFGFSQGVTVFDEVFDDFLSTVEILVVSYCNFLKIAREICCSKSASAD